MSDLAQRYGSGRAMTRPVVVVVTVLVAAAGLAWLVWAMWLHSTPLAQSQLVSYRVVDEHAARATFTVVRRTRGVEASCLLRASAADHSVVGELNFTVGPSDDTTRTMTRKVRTERRASSVELMGCVTRGQNDRR